jgi:hypothetical protein
MIYNDEHTFGTRKLFEACGNPIFPCNTLPERQHTENYQNRNETKKGHDGIGDDKGKEVARFNAGNKMLIDEQP